MPVSFAGGEWNSPITERGWWVTFGAAAAAVFFYGFVLRAMLPGVQPAGPAPSGPLRLGLTALAALAAVAAVAVSRSRLRPRGPAVAEPGQAPVRPAPSFQPLGMAALALAGVPAVCGFVLAIVTRGGLRDYVPFGAISLFVLVLEIGPRSFRYWQSLRAADPRALG